MEYHSELSRKSISYRRVGYAVNFVKLGGPQMPALVGQELVVELNDLLLY